MSENNIPKQNEDHPILGLLQQIKDGTVDADTLTKELRQSCVEILLGEGSSVALMAQVLKRSEKTIKRDIEDIRERNAIAPDINLAKKLVGELLMYVRINRDHLMKLARSKEASVSARVQSEYYAFRVSVEFISMMQSLGYLPQKPKEIIGDIYHHDASEIPDISDLEKQIIDIENLAGECAQLPKDTKEKIEELRIEFKKIQISGELKKIQEASKERIKP